MHEKKFDKRQAIKRRDGIAKLDTLENHISLLFYL